MRRATHSSTAGVVLILGIFLTGCRSVYRYETDLHADGSVDRAIYQPYGETPGAARRAGVWGQTINAPPPEQMEKEGWPPSLSQLPVQKGGDHKYFAAWGRFPSAKEVPEHYVWGWAAEQYGFPEGRLVRESSRKDFLFVVEHRWRETLTDIVRLTDMRQAREELADLSIQVSRDVFDEALEKDYDATDLVQWLRTEGKAWLGELTDYAFEQASVHKGQAARMALLDGLAEICARHGLNLKAGGKWLVDAEMERALNEYAIGLVCRHVRRKSDAKPVDRDTVAGWLRDLKEGSKKEKPGMFARAGRKVIEQKYGGEKALDRRTGQLEVRVLGLYLPGFLSAREFSSLLTVPGEVVETNGDLLAVNRVRWEFEGLDAYPLGYPMECRSLEAQGEWQMLLLNGRPLDSRAAMLAYVSLVSGSEGIAWALEECRKQKSLKPLYDYRQKARTGGTKEGETTRLDRLWKLLKLPENAPAGQAG